MNGRFGARILLGVASRFAADCLHLQSVEHRVRPQCDAAGGPAQLRSGGAAVACLSDIMTYCEAHRSCGLTSDRGMGRCSTMRNRQEWGEAR